MREERLGWSRRILKRGCREREREIRERIEGGRWSWCGKNEDKEKRVEKIKGAERVKNGEGAETEWTDRRKDRESGEPKGKAGETNLRDGAERTKTGSRERRK